MMNYKTNVFGELPIRPDKLIQQLEMRWSQCPRWPASSLTKRVFADLKMIGSGRGLKGKTATRKGLRSYFDGNEAKTRQSFLLDFLWWRQEFGTVLAVESELSARKIANLQHDFEKLLCWKSPMKLMITREIPSYDAGKIATALSNYAKKAVRQFVENECFVLFVFGKAGENSAFIHRVSKDRDNNFEFNPYPARATKVETANRQRRRRGRG